MNMLFESYSIKTIPFNGMLNVSASLESCEVRPLAPAKHKRYDLCYSEVAFVIIYRMGLVILVVATFAGAAMIRLTGLGFALVASPFFAIVLGPLQGVLLINSLTPFTNIIVLTRTRADVDLRHAIKLAIPAVCAIPVGALTLRVVPAPLLFIILGVLVIVAMAVVMYAKEIRLFGGRLGALEAGATSGLMNSVAGLGGPALTLYAMATKWPMRQFVPTVQVYYLIINVVFILINGLPALNVAKILLLGGAIVLGILVGDIVTKRVSDEQARKVMLSLALLGAITVIAKGIMTL